MNDDNYKQTMKNLPIRKCRKISELLFGVSQNLFYRVIVLNLLGRGVGQKFFFFKKVRFLLNFFLNFLIFILQ